MDLFALLAQWLFGLDSGLRRNDGSGRLDG
jgi:hypothetical protein